MKEEKKEFQTFNTKNMNIEISQEDYEFLKDLQHELNTQDDDCQAEPRYWGVMETRKEGVPEGCGDPYIYMGDGVTDTLEDAVEYVNEWLSGCDDDGDKTEIWKEIDKDDMNEVTDFIQVHIEPEARIVYMDDKHIISYWTGAFLTKRACKEYIRKYGYNHSNPQTYAMTAYRNFELERLLNILKTIKL